MSSNSSFKNDFISLPKGGGALSGLGEKFAADLHTGTGNLSIPLDIPKGRHELQPELTLEYSTGYGNGILGLGWQLAIPSISRKQSKGIPLYQDDRDTFLLSSEDDLVKISGNNSKIFYRPRIERRFSEISYNRNAIDSYWLEKYKNGYINTYGTPGQRGVDSAVVYSPTDTNKEFSWLLTKTEDSFNNAILYYYKDVADKSCEHSSDKIIDRIDYINYPDGGSTKYLITIQFIYEDRPDPVSTYRAGFLQVTSKRLSAIHIQNNIGTGFGIRKYRFKYEKEKYSQISLLKEIQVIGFDDLGNEMPAELAPMDFGYSTFNPHESKLFPVKGNLPFFSQQDKKTELVDLAGKGIPDIVELGNEIRYWPNLGNCRFGEAVLMKNAPSMELHLNTTSLIDANGDGRAELFCMGHTPGYFSLEFNGEWDRSSFTPYKLSPPVNLEDPEVRMLDLTGDGITDIIYSDNGMNYYFNNEDRSKAWLDSKTNYEPLLPFSDPRVKTGDMNGDGLRDIIFVESGNVYFWPNAGYGNWATKVRMKNSPVLPGFPQINNLLIDDINGDGLADMVLVENGNIRIYINQAGKAWSDPILIQGTPDFATGDDVRIIDLNGTGVAGILWSSCRSYGTAHNYYYLELAQNGKPYLLNRISNHMGSETRIGYASSSYWYRRDQEENKKWETNLPVNVQTVKSVEVIDLVSKTKFSTEYRYHHGHWDGEEREFRGFGMVEQKDSQTFEHFNSSGLFNGTSSNFVDQKYFSEPVLSKTWFHLGPVRKNDGVWSAIDFKGEFYQLDRDVLPGNELITDVLNSQPDNISKRDILRALKGSELRQEVYVIHNSTPSSVPFSVKDSVYGIKIISSQKRPVVFPFVQVQRTTSFEGGDDPLTKFAFADDYDSFGQPCTLTAVSMPRRHSKRKITVAKNYNTDLNEKRIIATCNFTNYVTQTPSNIFIHDRVSETKAYSYLDSFETYLESDSDDLSGILKDQYIQAAYIHHSIFKARIMAEMQLESHTLSYYDGNAFQGLPLGQIGQHGVVSKVETMVVTHSQLNEAYRNGFTPTDQRLPEYYGGPVSGLSNMPLNFGRDAGYFQGTGPSYEGGYYMATTRTRYDFQSPADTALGLIKEVRDPRNNPVTIQYEFFNLLPELIMDALGNQKKTSYNYRCYLPAMIIDHNGHVIYNTYNSIGLPEKIFRQDITGTLGGTDLNPDIFFQYSLTYNDAAGQPVSVTTLSRIDHALPVSTNAYLRKTEYSDGFGRLIQVIAQADDVLFGSSGENVGLSSDPAARNRSANGIKNNNLSDNRKSTIVSLWEVFDNKGRVVEKYEPFFSTGYNFIGNARRGQHAELYYDAAGRNTMVINPDGTRLMNIYGEIENIDSPGVFNQSPWQIFQYDANDLAPISDQSGISLINRAPVAHHFTPRSTLLNASGQNIATIKRNGPANDDIYVIRSVFDTRGNILALFDEKNRLATTYSYDLLDRSLRVYNIDSGNRTTVYNAMGAIIEARDDKGSLVMHEYDTLNRPIKTWAKDDRSDTRVRLIENIIYGEASALPGMRGYIYRHYDEAGLLEFLSYDFKGNLLEKTRQVIKYSLIGIPVDWSTHNNGDLEPTIYRSSFSFDALNRIKQFTYPADVHGTRAKLSPVYNPSGRLRKVQLNGNSYIEHISYNAKGQRQLIAYGNKRMTRYCYDPKSYRLVRLRTESFSLAQTSTTIDFNIAGNVLQDWIYDYDLSGNIINIHAEELGSGFTGHPDQLDKTFEYDPVYRLILASGREAGQPSATPDFFGTPQVINPATVAPYREVYEYDETGNLLFLRHRFNNSLSRVRQFQNETVSNRLQTISFSGNDYNYQYDQNGNLLKEGLTRSMRWDHSDRMKEFSEHDSAGNISTLSYYKYDPGGYRILKRIVRQNVDLVTVYIDGLFEHCIDQVNTISNNSLHIQDEQKRIAIIRTGNDMGDTAPPVQYQFADHLQSSHLIIGGADESGARRISTEEFSPYGESVTGSHAKKRYRYAGKERDEESGIYYYGARYYLPWTCKWSNCDPAGHRDSTNLYLFIKANAINFIDPSGMATKPTAATQEYVAQEISEYFHEQVIQILASNKGQPITRQQLGTLADDLASKVTNLTGVKGAVLPHYEDKVIGTSIDLVIPEMELAVELKLTEKAVRDRQTAKHMYLAYKKGWAYARVYGLGKLEPGKFGTKPVFFSKKMVKDIIEYAGMPKTFTRPGWNKYAKGVKGAISKFAVPVAVASILMATDAYASGEIDANEYGETLGRQSIPGEITYQIIHGAPEYLILAPQNLQDTPTGQMFEAPFTGVGTMDPRIIR